MRKIKFVVAILLCSANVYASEVGAVKHIEAQANFEKGHIRISIFDSETAKKIYSSLGVKVVAQESVYNNYETYQENSKSLGNVSCSEVHTQIRNKPGYDDVNYTCSFTVGTPE